MLLLSDGTVLAASGQPSSGTIGSNWYRLTPTSSGSYLGGTWSTLASMHYQRLYYSSDVLPDGRVFVAGSEYGNGTNTAEIYDPVLNTWTVLPSPGQTLYDSASTILPNGNVLVAPVFPSSSGRTLIYSPVSNAWFTGPKLFRGNNQDEASWVKLPDGSILTVDPFGTNSERYIPAQNKWINDSKVPVALYDSFDSEMGAALLLPSGKAFYLGATGNTAIYTPSGNTNLGSWAAGPVIPGGLTTPDAPAAMMVNGKILCAVSAAPATNGDFPSPTSFYEYDPVANSFASVTGPTGATFANSPFEMRMLALPDGNILFSASSKKLYLYSPGGTPLAAGQPAITGFSTNADGSYHLTGTLFNGISQGAAYGDDAQMDSNYPLVRMTNGTGTVYYCRTTNWSSTGVMTGSSVVSTDFRLPAGLASGAYSLVVVANGISSVRAAATIAGGALSVQPPLPPVFTTITRNSGGVKLAWTSVSTFHYQVQYSAGTTSGSWTNLGSPVLATNTAAIFTDAVSTDPIRYYRLLMTP